MSEISTFHGLIILMSFKEHAPQHFHVWHGEYKATVTINEGIVKGEMPQRALKMIFEWLDLHKNELLEDWDLSQRGEALRKIEPLKSGKTMLLEVTDAKYLGGYKINLTFNTGESKTVDLSEELEGKVFEPLKDKSYFQSFKIKYNTIEWSNGADYAPEFLLELSKKQELKNKKNA